MANPPVHVPFADLSREMDSIGPEIERAVLETVRSGWFILGKKLTAFEEAFASYLSANSPEPMHAAGCASGTDAVTLALLALGVQEGDTVVTTANTCAPTATGILRAGAQLGLVDAGPVHLMMDPALLEQRLKAGGVKAAVAVHLYGNMAPAKELRALCSRYGVFLVEDCAQAHGATLNGIAAGAFGHAAAFSFYPTKNLGAYGDGGAVVTPSGEIAQRVRALRNYGYTQRDWAEETGLNSRLDEVQAAVLLVKLAYLDEWNARRRAIAARYDAAVNGNEAIDCVPPIAGCESARHLYAVRCKDRDRLAAALKTAGIQTGVHYPHPLHRVPAFARYAPDRPLPVAESAALELLSLPIHPFLTEDEASRVMEAIGRFS